MHPNPAYRPQGADADARALCETLIDQIGFGMVFAATPDGPRVAHTPLFSTGDGAVQFHVSRGHALARHLDGATALALVNGPDGYISPRWYESVGQVPTWNYVALEMEGRVRRMDADGLVGLLEGLSARAEAHLPAPAWTMDKLTPERRAGLLAGCVGFEMEISAWRPTLKLSQDKGEADRAGVIAGLESAGASGVAAVMRSLGA